MEKVITFLQKTKFIWVPFLVKELKNKSFFHFDQSWNKFIHSQVLLKKEWGIKKIIEKEILTHQHWITDEVKAYVRSIIKKEMEKELSRLNENSDC